MPILPVEKQFKKKLICYIMAHHLPTFRNFATIIQFTRIFQNILYQHGACKSYTLEHASFDRLLHRKRARKLRASQCSGRVVQRAQGAEAVPASVSSTDAFILVISDTGSFKFF